MVKPYIVMTAKFLLGVSITPAVIMRLAQNVVGNFLSVTVTLSPTFLKQSL